MILAHEVFGSSNADVSLVVIHGITESRESWRPLFGAMGELGRVLAVDLRGHGESAIGDAYDPMSYAGDIIETCRHIGMINPIVVGHSLGGVVASAVAAMGGARAVVNIDQPLRLAGFKEGLSQLEPMLRGDQASVVTALNMVFASMFGPLSDAENARISANRRGLQQVVLGTWASVLESSVEELDATVEQLAAAISVDYLAIHGIDPGPDYAGWLTRLVPTATVEIWPEHGHYPHLVDSPRFIARLGQFIASVL
jgi:pimeloyl-ACP methyl ester carboxylesterase